MRKERRMVLVRLPGSRPRALVARATTPSGLEGDPVTTSAPRHPARHHSGRPARRRGAVGSLVARVSGRSRSRPLLRRRLTAPAVVAVLAALAVLASAGLAAPTALAADITLHWSILKCQFSDDTTHDVPGSPTNSDAQIADFLVNRGTDGIPDYVDDLSQGHLAVTGTISGWYTMPTTLAADPTIDSDRRVQDCIDTAQRAGWARPAGEPVVVFRNECTARGTNASTWVLIATHRSVGIGLRWMPSAPLRWR